MDYVVLRDMSMLPTGEPLTTPSRGPFTRPAGGPPGRTMRRTGALGLQGVKVERHDLSQGDLSDVERDPTIIGAAQAFPTRLITPLESTPAASDNTVIHGSAWGIDAVGATSATVDGADTIVAVLDTGIDNTHTAFSGMTLIEEDFSRTINGDADGHGTHCAGTIFGRDVDNTRIGVARGVTTGLIGKVFRDDGTGDTGMIVDAMKWATDNGAHIISMSLGFDFPGYVNRLITEGNYPPDAAASLALQGYRQNVQLFDSLVALLGSAANAGLASDALIFAAAGNSNDQTRDPRLEIAVSMPAATEGIVSVGAVEQSDDGLSIAAFSNTLPQIVGPGVNILSAQAGGGLRAISGTSMATPHMAGLAALWRSALIKRGRTPTADRIRTQILATATRTPLAAGFDPSDMGEGLGQAPAPLIG
ncbi:MAG: S8 family serine peptidase [Pseudomonadota bacterium]